MEFKNYSKEVKEILSKKKFAVTNTDADGLVSLAIVLKYFPQISFGGLYNNSTLTYDEVIKPYGKESIVGLDISFTKEFGIDSISNHVEDGCTGVSCNSHIGVDNYHDKSLFNTALFILASVDPQWIKQASREQMAILLTLDSTYLGFYSYNGRFKDKIVGYLLAYGLEEMVELLEESTIEDFHRTRDYFNLPQFNRMSNLDPRVIELFEIMELNIPQIKYQGKMEKVQGIWRKGGVYSLKKDREKYTVISNAMVYKGQFYYTILK